MDMTKDIQPMTTFRNHSAEIMQHLKATGRPVSLTINGRAGAVIQDAESYQRLLDLAAEADAAEGIRQGLLDLERPKPAGRRGIRRTTRYPCHSALTGRAEQSTTSVGFTIQSTKGASSKANRWFGGVEKAITSLDQHPARGPVIQGNRDFRHLLYGRRRYIYRIVYAIDERHEVVTVLHIRHSARDALIPDAT